MPGSFAIRPKTIEHIIAGRKHLQEAANRIMSQAQLQGAEQTTKAQQLQNRQKIKEQWGDILLENQGIVIEEQPAPQPIPFPLSFQVEARKHEIMCEWILMDSTLKGIASNKICTDGLNFFRKEVSLDEIIHAIKKLTQSEKLAVFQGLKHLLSNSRDGKVTQLMASIIIAGRGTVFPSYEEDVAQISRDRQRVSQSWYLALEESSKQQTQAVAKAISAILTNEVESFDIGLLNSASPDKIIQIIKALSFPNQARVIKYLLNENSNLSKPLNRLLNAEFTDTIDYLLTLSDFTSEQLINSAGG